MKKEQILERINNRILEAQKEMEDGTISKEEFHETATNLLRIYNAHKKLAKYSI